MALDIAEQIASFVRTRFRVSADDPSFDLHVHLFDEGYVDSAGVVELVVHLEQSYGIALPDDVLFSEDFTSIAGIASIVAALRESQPSSAASTDDRALELRPGSGTPLFCIGEPERYRALAETLAGPVFAIELPRDTDGAETTIEAMARACVRAIRSRASAPYRIVGASQLGVVAYEVAQQLTREAEHVELVALFETAPPSAIHGAPPRRIAAQLRALARHAPAYARAKLGVRTELAPALDTGEPLAHAVERYEPAMLPFTVRVVLYRPEHDRGYDHAPDLGWSRVASNLDVIRIPARDTSILHAPAVHLVADDLRSRARAVAA